MEGALVWRRFHLWTARVLVLGALSPIFLCGVRAQQQGSASEQSQQKPTSHPPKVFGVVEVPLIQIEAVVTGRGGNSVDGLKSENFALTENGRLQKIAQFGHFRADAEKEDVPIIVNLATPPDPEKLLPIALNHRMMVLFFDLTSMTDADVVRSMDAARGFVDQQMTPSDLVAVVSLSTQFKIISGFTNNREMLHAALTLLHPGYDKDLAPITGRVSDAPAEKNTSDTTADDMAFIGPDETETKIFNTDNELYAVGAFADILGSVPGRKSVIEFSSGIPAVGEVNQSALRTAISAANVNTVSFYEVDARETAAFNVASDAGKSVAHAKQLAELQDSRKLLTSLAQEAGGKYFAEVKDFAPIFRQVQEDSTDYYLLGYYSTDVRRDGLFRKVALKLVGVHGPKVALLRNGYYAPGK